MSNTENFFSFSFLPSSVGGNGMMAKPILFLRVCLHYNGGRSWKVIGSEEYMKFVFGGTPSTILFIVRFAKLVFGGDE